jgi:hypothetical protein
MLSFSVSADQVISRLNSLKLLVALAATERVRGSHALWLAEQTAALTALVGIDTPWQAVARQMGTTCSRVILHWWWCREEQQQKGDAASTSVSGREVLGAPVDIPFETTTSSSDPPAEKVISIESVHATKKTENFAASRVTRSQEGSTGGEASVILSNDTATSGGNPRGRRDIQSCNQSLGSEMRSDVTKRSAVRVTRASEKSGHLHVALL